MFNTSCGFYHLLIWPLTGHHWWCAGWLPSHYFKWVCRADDFAIVTSPVLNIVSFSRDLRSKTTWQGCTNTICCLCLHLNHPSIPIYRGSVRCITGRPLLPHPNPVPDPPPLRWQACLNFFYELRVSPTLPSALHDITLSLALRLTGVFSWSLFESA